MHKKLRFYFKGCNGGFNYLVAGKYAEDFGLVDEKCNPYTSYVNITCTTKPDCPRMYATGYEYVGGYYGAYVYYGNFNDKSITFRKLQGILNHADVVF